ncbi:MAG: hypothetical protein Q7T55_26705 [Solirubrobacteraceae bacterium]|nr:hypothetical protein [Solirubrobacteraceae bacterium]
MTNRTTLRSASVVAAAIAAAALTLPGVASAHTSVYTSQTKTAVGTPPTLVDGPIHYLVSNHGYNVVLRETNGVATGGVLNYKVLPSAWRTTVPKSTLLATATGAQPHATCAGLPQLDEAAVLAWQEEDPFYAYVPWQKTAAGLGDDAEVAKWVAVVKSRTGVDLTTVADPAAACTGLGGSFVPADTVQTTGAALSSGDIALVADPLRAQIEDYKKQLAAAVPAATAKAATDAAVASAVASEAAKTASADAALKASATPLAIAAASGSITRKAAGAGITATITGRPYLAVTVSATVTTKAKSKAKLPSSTLATATARLDAAGKATVTLKPSKKVASALTRAKGSLPVSLAARPAETATATATVAG